MNIKPMEKIIIHLEIPSIEKGFDMYIPTFMTIKELTKLVVQAVVELSDQHYVVSGNEVLCHKEKEIMLLQEMTVESYDIQNGDHIILI